MSRLYEASIGDEVHVETISPGCELYVYPLRGAKQTHILLTVDYGSIDRYYAAGSRGLQPSPPGVAHFLEHRLFEKVDGDITERFNELGSAVDAQTSFTNTEYSTTFRDRFADNAALLLETALEPHFTDDGIDREREIITREINLYEEEVEWVCFSTAMDSLYRCQPVGIDVAGTVESIKEIDRAILEACHHTFYRSERMAMFVCGDVDVAETRDQAGALWARYGHHTNGDPLPTARQRATPHPVHERYAVRMNIAQPRLCLAFHDPLSGRVAGDELLKRELCLEVGLDILFGPTSEFHARCYETGLIDSASFDFELFSAPEFSFCHIGGDTSEPERLEEAILREIEKLSGGDTIGDDLDRAMNKAFGALVRSYDDVEDCATMVYNEVFAGASPFAYFRTFTEPRAEDVQTVLAGILNPGQFGTAVVLPLDN